MKIPFMSANSGFVEVMSFPSNLILIPFAALASALNFLALAIRHVRRNGHDQGIGPVAMS